MCLRRLLHQTSCGKERPRASVGNFVCRVCVLQLDRSSWHDWRKPSLKNSPGNFQSCTGRFTAVRISGSTSRFRQVPEVAYLRFTKFQEPLSGASGFQGLNTAALQARGTALEDYEDLGGQFGTSGRLQE